MSNMKFRPYNNGVIPNGGKELDIRVWVHKNGYKVPPGEVYLQISTIPPYDETHFICGSLSVDNARELGNLLLAAANERTLVITDKYGQEHTFVNPAQVKEI